MHFYNFCAAHQKSSPALIKDDELIIGSEMELVDSGDKPQHPPEELRKSTLCQTVQSGIIRYSDVSTEANIEIPPLAVSRFHNDDDAVHYYTGLLSYERFNFVLNILGPAAFSLSYMYGSVQNISVKDQLFFSFS